jgi:hypothetical protein
MELNSVRKSANELFEEFSAVFYREFGYLPLGKDDVARPSAEQILCDLGETYSKLLRSREERISLQKELNRRSAPVAEARRFDIAKLPEQIVDDMVEILGWDMSSEEVAMAIGVVLKRLNANAALTSAEKPEEEKEVLNRAYKFIDLLLGNKEFLYRMTAEKVLRDLLEIITQHRIARKEG